MGMPITVELADARASAADMDAVFEYFIDIDRRFSTYKSDSEISRINRGEVTRMSPQMAEVFSLAEQTRRETGGFFNIHRPDGALDPSGIVKGWAIRGAARLAEARGLRNFYVDAGGDIQTRGLNAGGSDWQIGIRSPFNYADIVKVIVPRGAGVATSGTAARGAHIYNPHAPQQALSDVVSITVVGPDILEADRFATAAFAMGPQGIAFIESLNGFEGYSIDSRGIATLTTGLGQYTA